jgi:predicted MPP superfamily phosphohydrolase
MESFDISPSDPLASSPAPDWEPLVPGLRRLRTAPGPSLQMLDAVGFEWNTYELAIADLPPQLAGFRIVHLSDLHCRRRWQRAYDHLASRLAADVPDLIIFTGDAVENKNRPHLGLPTARRLMDLLPARLGVLGIRGNHDPNVHAADFARTPLRLIDGQRLLIDAARPGKPPGDRSGGRSGDRPAQLEIIAMPGPERENVSHGWFNQLPRRTPGVPRIVMSHYPDHIIRMRWTEPDVYLAGHTHGGQMCLPGGFAPLRHDSLPRALCRGVHRFMDTWYIVNRGLGFSSLPIRTWCPAEVIELRLVRG